MADVSLKTLMNCSDVDFEKMVRGMDPRNVLGVMNKMIAEMDIEQGNFDSLSSQIDTITDQASAEFKDISSELVKSQNKLALLMSRNMFCFNLQKEEKIKPEPIVTQQARPATNKVKVRLSNTKVEAQNGTSGPAAATTTTTSKKKVVKVTRVITRKVITDTEDLDPQLKSIMESRRKMIKDYSKPTEKPSEQKPNETSLEAVKSVSTSTLITPQRSVVNKPGSVSQTNTATASVQLTRDRSSSAPKRAVVKLRSDSNGSSSPTTPRHSANGESSNGSISKIPSSNIDDIITVDDAQQTRSSQDMTSSPRLQKEITSSVQLNDSAASSDTDTSHTTSSSLATDLAFDFNSMDFESEKVKERVFMKAWNPVKLLNELYKISLAKERAMLSSSDIINMEGYVEQLPLGKKKTTLLKTWKRIYCKAKDGGLFFFRSKGDQIFSHLSIMGGAIEESSNCMIGIDDMRGHYLMIRCPNEAEYRDWLRSLYTQIKCSPALGYIRPTLTSPSHQNKVVVIDLGSTSVRAGILGNMPSYPQLFFPCVTSADSEGRGVFGIESYHPENRGRGLHHPVAPTKNTVDKYRINAQVLQDLFSDILRRLEIDPTTHMVMLATPHKFSTMLQEEVLNILLTRLQVKAANIVNQSLLTPYLYNATSGIVVDIGERIDIVAITDGYLVEGGMSRRAYGGTHVTDNLNSSLMEYRLFTPVEHLITRLIKEKTCYVSQDYDDDLLECMGDSTLCQATVDLEQFDLPEGAHLKLITVDSARFKAPEGLLRSELLGYDSPTLPKLIQQAVTKCPMDLRREMWQSIYLSGGSTLIEGFPERLESELRQIAPASVAVQVHASTHRYHGAYIGACALAKLPNFTQSCITRDEWARQGKSTLSKWRYYFQS